MVDVVLLVAVALLAAGVVGTLVPLVPGGLLSLSGVYFYWWQSNFAEPGTITMIVLTILGLVTLFVEYFAGSIAARAGGASWTTTGLAAVVGILLMLVTGPLGLLVGLFGTVFVVEFVRAGDVNRSTRSAIYATLGILASTAVQALLTVSILFGFLIGVFVF
ncbi:DUF456 family protein [Natrialba magadii ATCC 43099]|uniref:DUF456 family protein n=1 Tax=Natrialba magadii (strain ATCC 43099 / DSM 3394 / CCM 3739 / CIP 104546 / IAM 13178 / JCM 8861 / NBRC 102185 / NCIMB 2190 / MS3) TaxID=547559 RepID=D3SXZ6_NATMM|nr:DUF456 domain-containing protein [Natrialba magadii]ADD04036.1 DUF456 family protein [Natrialba magadii ATCC 43099]ELY33193.1 hypothetical protein C500_02654 [Natrialba magadii ATCC 43099]